MSDPDVYPEIVARFYDVIYDKVRSGIDLNFFAKQAAGADGPVLEAGCGTGRLMREALIRGANIYGIDNSPYMIDIFRARTAEEYHPRVEIADIRTFRHPRKYALILAPFRVFSHLCDVKSQRNALQNVYEHLLPGGRFIFDLYVPDFKMLLNGLQRVTDFEGMYKAGMKLKRITSMNACAITQISHVTMDFEWEEEQGMKHASWSFDMRFFFRYELEHLIGLSPLKLDKIEGDYQGSDLLPESKEFVIWCSNT